MSKPSFSLKILIVTALASLSFTFAAQDAEAQRFRLFRNNKAKAAKPAKAEGGKLNTKAFAPAQVSAGLKASLRGKALMVAPKNKTKEYTNAMKKNSIEVMFQPNASSYGHLLIRVGERLYDMPGPWGARNQRFDRAMGYVNSPAYGFVYARTPKQIEKLQKEFDAMINARHEFSIAGTGPTSFSCAGFVTRVLKDHAPELSVGLSAGAIGAAGRILRAGKHDAVTLYGAAANQADRADFKFLKLQ